MNFKTILCSVATLGVLVACNNAEQKQENTNQEVLEQSETVPQNTDLGRIVFDESAFDFGKVKEGEVVQHVFTFKNTGKAPVILSQVTASCGCTTPEYTKDPVLPGATGEVSVSFNSQGQVGTQQKIVTISSNAENRATTVQIKGIVEN